MATKKEAVKSAAPVEAVAPQEIGGVPAIVESVELIPMSIDEIMEDAGAGFDGMTGADKMTPFLAVLQKGSPQVDEASPKYVDGARAGMLYNTVFGTLYPGKTGVRAVYCGFKSAIVRWKSRDSGGGLVGHLAPNDPIIATAKPNAKGVPELPNGDVLIDTSYHFILVIDPDDPTIMTPAVIGMASTQKRTSRMWNTKSSMLTITNPKTGKSFKAPIFAHAWRITTVANTKDQYSWYTFAVEVEGLCAQPEYVAAREFNRQIIADQVKIGAPPQEFSETAATDKSEEVPF